MHMADDLPPGNLRETLARSQSVIRGWLADSAEGAAAPYEDERYPHRVMALVERMRRRNAAVGRQKTERR